MTIWKRLISLMKQVSLTLFVTVILLLAIEGCVRIFYTGVGGFDAEKFLASRPKPFENDPDFEVIFSNSCEREIPPIISNNDEIFYKNDFSCGGVTYKNRRRLTVPTLENRYLKTVHIFGGSTVWGTGATDANTIPSLIQSEVFNKNIRVINYGISSVVADQQRQILQKNIDQIKKGDIVLFYDGGNDFWNSVMQGNIGGTIVGFNQKNRVQLFLFEVRNWLARNTRTYVALSDLRHGRKASLVCQVNLEEASKRVAPAAIYYANSIHAAKKMSEEKGALFVHFFQPTLFDAQQPTAYEQELYRQNPCFSVAQKLKPEFNHIFLTNSNSSVDLSTIFNNKDLFWDYIHTSAKGNKEATSKILPYLNELIH